jgi:hypothetical protein
MHDTRAPLSLSVEHCADTLPVLRHDGLRIAERHGGQCQREHTVLWPLNVRTSRSVRDLFKGWRTNHPVNQPKSWGLALKSLPLGLFV